MKVTRKGFRHPLSDFVLALYKQHQVLDRGVLYPLLAGAIFVNPPSLGSAYYKVALDVLECMLNCGELERCRAGWYWLAGTVPASERRR